MQRGVVEDLLCALFDLIGQLADLLAATEHLGLDQLLPFGLLLALSVFKLFEAELGSLSVLLFGGFDFGKVPVYNACAWLTESVKPVALELLDFGDELSVRPVLLFEGFEFLTFFGRLVSAHHASNAAD